MNNVPTHAPGHPTYPEQDISSLPSGLLEDRGSLSINEPIQAGSAFEGRRCGPSQQ